MTYPNSQPQVVGYNQDGSPIWGYPPSVPAQPQYPQPSAPPAPPQFVQPQYPQYPQQPPQYQNGGNFQPQQPEPEWENAPDDYYESLRSGDPNAPKIPFLRPYPGPAIRGQKPQIGYRFGGVVISAETRQQSEQVNGRWRPKLDKANRAMFETVLTLQTDVREGPDDNGVRKYSTKNFQERQLIGKIEELTGRKQKPMPGLAVFFTCTAYFDPVSQFPVNQWIVEAYLPDQITPEHRQQMSAQAPAFPPNYPQAGAQQAPQQVPQPPVQVAPADPNAAYSQGTSLLDQLRNRQPQASVGPEQAGY